MGCWHQTYGLITGFTVGEGLEVLVDDKWVRTRNGDESSKRMVSGWNAILWRSGICAGKNNGII